MRKTMTTGSQTITFHYDENKNVTHETDGNNQVIASYTYADNELVSMTRDGKTYYYQLNGQGDVIALTDSTGVVVATYEYDSYGNLLKETGNVKNPYRYAGYRYDKETGLYYLQSRYYKPETGRFLTRDTFDGVESEPLSLNKYLYVENSPVIHDDRDGLFKKVRNRLRKKGYKMSRVGADLIRFRKRVASAYIPQTWIDSAFGFSGMFGGAREAYRTLIKRAIAGVAAKAHAYIWISVAALWSYTQFTGRRGVTIIAYHDIWYKQCLPRRVGKATLRCPKNPYKFYWTKTTPVLRPGKR